MKARVLTIVAILVAVLLLALTYQLPARDPDAIPAETGMVVMIQTANPYRFDVRLEVKCDWEWQKGAYRFHQFIVVPAKRQTLIKVPNNLKLCEIWPKVIW
jgi:hypothetical protein